MRAIHRLVVDLGSRVSPGLLVTSLLMLNIAWVLALGAFDAQFRIMPQLSFGAFALLWVVLLASGHQRVASTTSAGRGSSGVRRTEASGAVTLRGPTT